MERDTQQMIAVGLIWGATNALMRLGALIWDQRLKSSPPRPDATHHRRFLASLEKWLNLLLTWQYSVPFLLNLSASAAFFALLGGAPISIAVPVTNATTFAATAAFGAALGEETRVGLALFGLSVCYVRSSREMERDSKNVSTAGTRHKFGPWGQ